jgi:taurine dioxygenase
MPITIHPLDAPLGAEIQDLDLREEIDDATMATIKQAWRDHLVLLFRDQELDEDAQVRFARRFGALERRLRKAEALADADRVANPGYTMLISNIREDGKLIGSLPDGEVNFHSDQCFAEKPPSGTFLYAIEVPSQGGETVLANMYMACEELPNDLRAAISDRTALHVYMMGAPTRDSHTPDFNVNPHWTHPAIITHPETGRDVLYLNRLCTWRINGYGDKEAAALLDRVLDHAEQKRFQYAHKWQPGDLLLWDNRCTQHARNDFSDRERRLLRRCVVESDRTPFNCHKTATPEPAPAG